VLPASGSYVFSLNNLELWHAQVGHVNFQYLCLLFPELIKACKFHKFKCVVCELSKHVRTSYISRMHRVPAPFDLIHYDVWGPSPTTTLSGHRYYVTFIDDHTRCTWLYLLKKKSEVFAIFTQFLHSATPFCSGVWAQVSCCKIPFWLSCEQKSLEIYTPHYQIEYYEQ